MKRTDLPETRGECRAPGCWHLATTSAVSEMLGEIDVCERHGAELSGETIPFAPPPTSALVTRGECAGCHQRRPLAPGGTLCAACL